MYYSVQCIVVSGLAVTATPVLLGVSVGESNTICVLLVLIYNNNKFISGKTSYVCIKYNRYKYVNTNTITFTFN